MSDSSHSVLRIVGWVVRIGVYVGLAGIVLFFALTRTEVGRDEIRRQIQATFDQQFAGSLHIGVLRGTLLNELRATHVRLRDEEGRLVATIDSVTSEPRWRDLLTAEVSVQSLTLFRPHLLLHRRADRTWNLQRALERRTPSPATRPLDLALANVEIRDGRVTTTRSGPAPSLVADRWLYDYTHTEIDSIHAEAALQWGEARRHVALRSLGLRLPSKNLALTSARAQIVEEPSRWRLETFALRVGNTRLNAQGSLLPSPRDSTQSVVDLQVAESQVDHDQLRRLMPRLPLRGVVSVEGRLGGSPDRLVVNELTVSHRQSRLTVEGTAFGLPDSLDVDGQILQSRVRPGDVRSVWPDAPLGRMRAFGPVDLSAAVTGLVEWGDRPRPSFDLEGSLSAQGAPGAVRGSLAVRRSGTAPARYDGRLDVDSLDIAPLTGDPRLESRLTGRLTLEGRGLRLASVEGALSASLAAGRVGPRRFSGVDLDMTADAEGLQGALALRQPAGGTLRIEGALGTTGEALRYDAEAALTEFNLAAAHPPLPPSRLNATLTLGGRGNDWQTFVGEVGIVVDSSSLRRRDSTHALPPHQATLTLSPPSSPEPRVQLTGTLASATIEGRPLHPAVRRAGRFWTATAKRTYRREVAKASRPPLDSAAAPFSDADLQGTDVRDGTAPFSLRGELAIRRMDLLRTWWPNAPEHADSLWTTTRLTLGPDTLSASGQLAASSLQVGARRVASLEASYHVSGPYRPDLLNGLTAEVAARADTLRFGDRAILRPSATLTLARRQGRLEAQTEQIGRTGPFHLDGEVTVKRGLHFRLTDLYAGMGENAWVAERPATISAYANAVVVDTLDVTSPRPRAEDTQHLRLYGTVSPAASDTLRTEMTDVLLYPVGELAALPRSLGGELNGMISVTGGWAQPQVRSALRVRRLSFDRRLLGDLQVRTRLTPRSPDLLVDAALTPGTASIEALEGPALVPQGLRAVEENQLNLEGRVRLPGWVDAPAAPPEQLDLTLNVQRADLFFFRYIFDESLARARGYTAGQIRIGGRFRRPVFDAELEIRNARFTLPQFGLAYTASGPVEVDRRGIHLRDLAVSDGAGSAVVRGSVLFNDYRYFSFDLSAQLDEITIIDVTDAQDLAFYGDIRASGPASLTGPLQDATLRSEGARTTPESELYIPVSEGGVDDGTGFIVFADSTGQIPDLRDLTRRDNIFSDRPAGEPSFLEGLEIDINVMAPEGSTVNLVFDPIVGDVVTAVGAGRVQLQRQEGEFFVYGNFDVSGGTYLFTAGEVFVRRFNINGGTISWDGPPINAQLGLEAEYRTRASPAGLPGYDRNEGRIPVRVQLDIGGRVETPQVELSLARVRDERNNLVGSQTLDAILNQADRTTEYATSVLLTNTFLLTTESFTGGGSSTPDGSTSGSLATAGNRLAFNSVSQLVASQLNRYLGAALPNVDLNFGLQGENADDLDLIYGVALQLLNERLVIRGEGVYTGDDPSDRRAEGPQGEFVVEVRLNERISVEAFYRRTGDELTRGQTLTSSTGAGVSYQTEFPSWRQLLGRIFGWLIPGLTPPAEPEPGEEPPPEPEPVARTEDPPSESADDGDDAPDG